MTKYPIKHTMVFGEETCPDCGGSGEIVRNGYECYRCGRCQGKGNIPLSVTFDLVKDCPECEGLGVFMADDIAFIGVNKVACEKEVPCADCSENGLPEGKVSRYWTPEEAAEHIKKETGIDWEWAGSTPVWHLFDTPIYDPYDGQKPYYQLHEMRWFLEYESNELEGVAILAIFGQPAPPADYRP